METFADPTEFRTSLQESWKSNPSIWDDVLGERNTPELQEIAEAVCLQLLEDPGHLERVLVARGHDAPKSTAMFWEQVEFRARYQPDQIDALTQIPTALSSGAWRLSGYTRDGHVISNYKLQHWDPDAYAGNDTEKAVEEYILYVCYMIEKMLQAGSKHDRFYVVFDLSGFYLGMALKSNICQMIYHLIYVAQEQYPECLEKALLVNVPWGFETAWKLVRPLLDHKTASKIHFCGSCQDLLQDIDESTLSTAYGGTHEEYPIPDGK